MMEISANPASMISEHSDMFLPFFSGEELPPSAVLAIRPVIQLRTQRSNPAMAVLWRLSLGDIGSGAFNREKTSPGKVFITC
ncbi:MAG: hypothetical protein LBK65_06940 [Tannerellaceae bacterium]|nr:hypothetical protein [Tannerellaceae bacterium]